MSEAQRMPEPKLKAAEEPAPAPKGFIGRIVQKVKTNKPLRKKLLIAVGSVAALFAAHLIYEMLVTEETDDAFVTSRVHNIGSRIAGTVMEVKVLENQPVKKGDVLVQLDARDYEVQMKIAEANYARANKDMARWRGNERFDPTDRLLNNADTAKSLTTQAEYDQAKLQLEYTQITAPVDGHIGTRGVESGEHVAPGQALLALVEDNPWIVANFKEGQVSKIRVGQEVDIKVDAVPEHHFTGKVNSISPGSGATFALLPPDNATGNFTKVVQRIPVKILFDAESVKGYEKRLAAGMSTVVVVHTGW